MVMGEGGNRGYKGSGVCNERDQGPQSVKRVCRLGVTRVYFQDSVWEGVVAMCPTNSRTLCGDQ